MASDPDQVHMETDNALAGSTPHIVRWILGISLPAVIVLLSIVWITGALVHNDSENKASASAASAGQGSAGENADRNAAADAADTVP